MTASERKMEQGSPKPVVLTFIGNYLPGYKAGGILRSVVNAVDHLCEFFDFWIVTRDRDVGEELPYQGIEVDRWQRVGNAMVFYLGPGGNLLSRVTRLVSSTPHDVLYLNSFFDPLTICALSGRRLGISSVKKPVVLAPRGEFAWGSLRLKYPKKRLFMLLARTTGLYKDLVWAVSSEFEAEDLNKVFGVPRDAMRIALDLPTKALPRDWRCEKDERDDHPGTRIVFISRIAREKNLDFALHVCRRVRAEIAFDIYGPAEDEAYWRECAGIIDKMPSNVKVSYLGCAKPEEVISIFSRYDLFLFPSCGENYGHVVAESLLAGTPVLVSTKTPWRNLEADGLGWDVPLEEMDTFVSLIESLAALEPENRCRKRSDIRQKIVSRLLDPAVLDANRRLFADPVTG